MVDQLRLCDICHRAHKGECEHLRAKVEPQEPKVCRHRSEPKGKASCGCGLVYECRLLGKLCGDTQPLEFANFGKVILTDETYQRCWGCAEFTPIEEQRPKLP